MTSFKKNSLFKTTYLCKTTCYEIFFKKNLFKTAYLYKTAYYDLFSKKQLISAKQLITISISKIAYSK